MQFRLRLILTLLVVFSAPAFAQTTHLNTPVKQFVRIVFGQKSGDAPGIYRTMVAQFGDDATDSDWQIPEGMTLVITDISLASGNDGNPQPKEGLFWVYAWELANPNSSYRHLRIPISVRVEANTPLSVLTRSYTAGLAFNHDWQPAILDLANGKNQIDITLSLVRPIALGYLIQTK
jgi:hypothetical protein